MSRLIDGLTRLLRREKAPVRLPDVGEMDRMPVRIIRPQSRSSWEQITPTSIGNPWTRVPSQQNLQLFEQLAETIPLLNAAIDRLVELVGCPKVKAADDAVEAEINEWLGRLVVNRVQVGFGCWFATWLRDMLLYGRAHAEIILPQARNDIWGIQELHPRTLDFRPSADGYNLDLVQFNLTAGAPVTLNKALILTAVHDVQADQPHGNSLFFGLPFVAEILTSMFKDQKRIWERFGTPSYHINYEPPDEFNDPTGAKSQEYVASFMAAWNTMMESRAKGDIQDFGSAGKITVTVIGAAGETLEFVAPARAIAEQVVAKTGLPPMMLGLQWQTGERIGAVQASLLCQRIQRIREAVEPQIRYLIRLRQTLAGSDPEFEICWKDVTLIDQVETSRARLMDAQAETQEIGNAEKLWRMGVWSRFDVARAFAVGIEEDATDEEVAAALPDLQEEPPAAPAPLAAPGQQDPNADGEGGGPTSGRSFRGLKAITHGDAEVSFGGGEKPKYRALGQAINGYYADLLKPLEVLQRKTYAALGIGKPRKADGEEAFTYSEAQRIQIDAAIDGFLATLAGPDRSASGFIAGGIESDAADGVIQQRNLFSFAVGLQRASGLLETAQTLQADRNSPATRAMLEHAFARLSEGGALRLEGVRDEIHGILTSATEAGISPLETARQLSAQFDQYKSFEFQRLARTEAAFAAEEGTREQFRDLGVERVEVLISAGACPICQSYEGQVFSLEDLGSLPPYHPNCLCSVVPVTGDDHAE